MFFAAVAGTGTFVLSSAIGYACALFDRPDFYRIDGSREAYLRQLRDITEEAVAGYAFVPCDATD